MSGEGPAVEAPPCPSATLFLHLSARVCGTTEFVAAHGPHALHSFLPIRPGNPSSGMAHSSSGGRIAAALAGGGAGRRPVTDTGTAGAVHAAAVGATRERAVMSDVLASLMSELVREGPVGDAFESLSRGAVPTFAQVVAGAGAEAASSAALAPRGGGGGGSSGEALTVKERSSVLVLPEFQDLVGRLVENAVLNLGREACHGEFDVCKPPVTVVRL